MIFISEYGMSKRQEAWLEKASKDEQHAFLLMAPVRIAVQMVRLHATGELKNMFIPTIHGIPVSHKGACVFETPEEAQQAGEAEQEACRTFLNGREVPLDLKKLRIAGPAVDEYSTPEGRGESFKALCLALKDGQDMTPVEA